MHIGRKPTLDPKPMSMRAPVSGEAIRVLAINSVNAWIASSDMSQRKEFLRVQLAVFVLAELAVIALVAKVEVVAEFARLESAGVDGGRVVAFQRSVDALAEFVLGDGVVGSCFLGWWRGGKDSLCQGGWCGCRGGPCRDFGTWYDFCGRPRGFLESWVGRGCCER